MVESWAAPRAGCWVVMSADRLAGHSAVLRAAWKAGRWAVLTDGYLVSCLVG